MKKLNSILIYLCIACFATHLQAQQNLFGGQDIKSAVVNEDKTVTFRFIAPDAKQVQIAGDFAPTVEDNPVGGLVGTGLIGMVKDGDGIWTHTTPPLESELYSYLFVVDGVAVTDPNHPHALRDFATISNVFIVGGGQADLYKVNQIPHGSLTHRWYESPSLGMTRRINIYTPPGYENSGREYPVLYLLHGMGGDENEWISFGRAVQIMDNLIHQGKAKPMIVVMTNGHAHLEAAYGESSKGFFKPEHAPAGTTPPGAFEASFRDVIDFVDSNFRVKSDKAHRAIAGLSMGGGHSMNISRYYENTFDYVGLFSAAVRGRQDNATGVYADFDATLKKQFDNGLKLYWIGMGTEDFLYDACTEYRAKLDSMGAKYTYVETGRWTHLEKLAHLPG